MLAAVNLDGKPIGATSTPLAYLYADESIPSRKITSWNDRANAPNYGDGPFYAQHSLEEYECKGSGITYLDGRPATGYGPTVYMSDTIFDDPSQVNSYWHLCYPFWVDAGDICAKGRYQECTDGTVLMMAFFVRDDLLVQGCYFKSRQYQLNRISPLSIGQVVPYVRNFIADHRANIKAHGYYYASAFAVNAHTFRKQNVVGPCLGEHNFWLSRVYELPGGPSAIDVSGFVKAYYMAFDKLPRVKQNTIANVLECITTIKSFRSGFLGFSSLKEFSQNAWLAYRYQYKTTVSDLEELTNVVGRLITIAGSDITSYGYAVKGEVAYHAAITVDSSVLIPGSIKSSIKALNARLTLTNIWDMIPYSFVVDWFLQISAVCEALDVWADSIEMPIKTIWYSFTSSRADYPGVRAYGRWLGQKPALPYISYSSASDKTIVMRVADTLSLFF